MSEAWERSRRAKRKGLTWVERWKLMRDLDGWHRCWVYLSALVYRLKNDRHLAGNPQPEPDVLAAALSLYFKNHLSKFLASPEGASHRLKGYQDFAFIQHSRVDYLAARIALAIHEQWTPEFIERKQREGAMSSSRGRPVGRGVFASPEARARLDEMRRSGSTHRAVAEEFRVTTKTVQRALREQSPVETEEIRPSGR